MGRGKPLCETEKGQIMAFKNMGLSNRKIAGRIHRSINVINNFVKLGENYSKKKNQQVVQKLCRRDIGKILQEVRTNKLNASLIQVKLDLPVGVRRVTRHVCNKF